jgi:hypothetical protein
LRSIEFFLTTNQFVRFDVLNRLLSLDSDYTQYSRHLTWIPISKDKIIMLSKKKSLTIASLMLLLTACKSTSGVDAADKNQFVTEFYAIVASVEQIKFKSKVGSAVIIGAAGGAISGSGGDRKDVIGGAMIGGVVSGIIAALFEGSTKGYEYQLDAIDGDRVKVIVEDKAAELGECVKVRVSGTVSLAKVPLETCDSDEAYVL